MTTDEAFMASLAQLCEKTLDCGSHIIGDWHGTNVFVKQVTKEIENDFYRGPGLLGGVIPRSILYTVEFYADFRPATRDRARQSYDFESDAEEIIDPEQLPAPRRRLPRGRRNS